MKKLKIRATGSSEWIGGLYYKRNVLFSLLQNEYICSNYKIIVASSEKFHSYFSKLQNGVTFLKCSENPKISKLQELMGELQGHTDYEFPATENKIRHLLHICPINWIPDFQHNYYPEYFTEEELQERTMAYREIQQGPHPLVLSSQTCLGDFVKFYGEKKNTYVIPFVSYIEPEVMLLKKQKEQEILDQYGLRDVRYACVSNQFWQHKNHVVVLEAIKKLRLKQGEFKFVFTGSPKDYRNPEYYQSLMQLLVDPEIKPHVAILGFIDRLEQIAIMKNSEFIIQPSLFEGWGTVVEDAKVLDKKILLSDIPVHREQMNENCVLFDPKSSDELAEKIYMSRKEKHLDDLQKGIKDMYQRAALYSVGFEKLLRDLEDKRN